MLHGAFLDPLLQPPETSTPDWVLRQIEYSRICSDILDGWQNRSCSTQLDRTDSLHIRLRDWKGSDPKSSPESSVETDDSTTASERRLVLFCQYHEALFALHGGSDMVGSQPQNERCLESAKAILEASSCVVPPSMSPHMYVDIIFFGREQCHEVPKLT